MRTSIVVVPRERFTSLPVSLRSLFATIPGEVPVVVVEGGTPSETRAELTSLADERPFELVSLPYMVKPNEARNLGVARTSSEFVVIADNDIEYEPGWLGRSRSMRSRTGRMPSRRSSASDLRPRRSSITPEAS